MKVVFGGAKVLREEIDVGAVGGGEWPTMGICRPFPDLSSWFPKHWDITALIPNPLHKSTPISRYWPVTDDD